MNVRFGNAPIPSPIPNGPNLRDLFAMNSAEALIGRGYSNEAYADTLATLSYTFADKLLLAREGKLNG